MSNRRHEADPEGSAHRAQPWREWISTPRAATGAPFLAEPSSAFCEGDCRHLFASDVVGVIVGRFGGGITDANDAFLDLTGYARADLPLSSDATLFPELPALNDEREQVLPDAGGSSWETEVVAIDGRHIPVLVGAWQLRQAGPEYIAFVLDLTRTKEVEVALRRSEERFKALYDQSPSISLTVDREGVILSINSDGAAELGYSKDALVGVPVLEVVHQEDRAVFRDQLEGTSRRLAAVASRTFRHLRKDGSALWVRGSVRSMLDSDGRMMLLLVSKDLTEQKENEERLLDYQTRLRTLTLALGLAEERERRRIALGLHDNIGHTLALARMKLGACEQRRGGDADDELGAVGDLIDDAIRATRQLTFDLSSPILYELGLEAALQNIGEQVLEANGVRFAFHATSPPTPLPTDTSVVLYRSVRELLVNVVKHAHARSVSVALSRVGNRVEIRVADDGVGFESSAIAQWSGARRGYGLFSIGEQLRAMGGQIEIESAPGEGTTCRLVASLESAAE